MGLDLLLRFAFVFYCTTVGVVLIWLPWTPGWEVIVSSLPWSTFGWLESPLARGCLSGFGLVHLVWVANDLEDLLRPGYRLHVEEDP